MLVFDIDEIQKLMQYDLAPPSSVLQASMQGDIDIKDYDANISKMLKKLGTKKGPLSKGQGKTKNKDKIDKIDEDIKLLQKYRGRIKIIPEGMKPSKKVLVILNQREMHTKYHLLGNMVD